MLGCRENFAALFMWRIISVSFSFTLFPLSLLLSSLLWFLKRHILTKEKLGWSMHHVSLLSLVYETIWKGKPSSMSGALFAIPLIHVPFKAICHAFSFIHVYSWHIYGQLMQLRRGMILCRFVSLWSPWQIVGLATTHSLSLSPWLHLFAPEDRVLPSPFPSFMLQWSHCPGTLHVCQIHRMTCTFVLHTLVNSQLEKKERVRKEKLLISPHL